MGWSGGTEIFDCVAEDLLALEDTLDYVSGDLHDQIFSILVKLLNTLEWQDWDNLGESKYWTHPVIGKILGNDFEEEE